MLDMVKKGFFFGLGFAAALMVCLAIYNGLNRFSHPTNYRSIGHLPVKDQFEESSLIVRTVYIDDEEIIEEIVKQSTDVEFGYAIGDEYDPWGTRGRDEVIGGDGRIILHTGSPPFPVLSRSYNLELLAKCSYDVEQFYTEIDKCSI